jgi:hypothetical protein
MLSSLIIVLKLDIFGKGFKKHNAYLKHFFTLIFEVRIMAPRIHINP